MLPRAFVRARLATCERTRSSIQLPRCGKRDAADLDKRHLGIHLQDLGGAAFTWTDGVGKAVGGTTIWGIGPASANAFAPGTASFMINRRVEGLHALVAVLREAGCEMRDKMGESRFGKFAAAVKARSRA